MTRSRRADFEVAVEVVGNVADLDHFAMCATCKQSIHIVNQSDR